MVRHGAHVIFSEALHQGSSSVYHPHAKYAFVPRTSVRLTARRATIPWPVNGIMSEDVALN